MESRLLLTFSTMFFFFFYGLDVVDIKYIHNSDGVAESHLKYVTVAYLFTV